MMTSVLYVALGGAVGSVLRYLSGVAFLRVMGPSDFPFAILFVNITGSFLMGVFVAAAAHKGLTHLSPLVMTGLLGGFTTFSAFSLETVTLIERGQIGSAMLYVSLSVAVSVGALMVGLYFSRGIFS